MCVGWFRLIISWHFRHFLSSSPTFLHFSDVGTFLRCLRAAAKIIFFFAIDWHFHWAFALSITPGCFHCRLLRSRCRVRKIFRLFLLSFHFHYFRKTLRRCWFSTFHFDRLHFIFSITGRLFSDFRSRDFRGFDVEARPMCGVKISRP